MWMMEARAAIGNLNAAHKVNANEEWPGLMAISPHNKFSYRFDIERNGAGRWEITDHQTCEHEELISDEEIWLADRLEVIEDTCARHAWEIGRLKSILRKHGLLDESLTPPEHVTSDKRK